MNFAHSGTATSAAKPFGQNRVRLIEADPDAGHQLRREADEPGVVEVVGRAGLAGGRQREARARARASPVPALITSASIVDIRNAVVSLIARDATFRCA